MLLKKKTAVVTGCLRGIGRVTMDLFAEQGADIIALCEYETEEWKSHAEDLKRRYGR